MFTKFRFRFIKKIIKTVTFQQYNLSYPLTVHLIIYFMYKFKDNINLLFKNIYIYLLFQTLLMVQNFHLINF